jgi:hypothetical protein
MSISLKQINSEKVSAIKITDIDERPVKGASLVPECYSNIFCVARKNSGKTSCCFKILQKTVGKNTIIIAFVSTLYNDKCWLEIQKWAKKKNIPFIGYTSLIDDNGVDQLSALVKKLEQEAQEAYQAQLKAEEEEDIPKEPEALRFDDEEDEDEENQKPRKSKYKTPEYVFVLDDLSTELKSRSVVSLVKKNRHFLSKVIISSQYPLDLDPQARKQIDLWILFKGHSIEKLEEIYKSADLSIPFDLFMELYKHATKEKYSFLWVNPNDMEFRRGFSHKYVIPNHGVEHLGSP